LILQSKTYCTLFVLDPFCFILLLKRAHSASDCVTVNIIGESRSVYILQVNYRFDILADPDVCVVLV